MRKSRESHVWLNNRIRSQTNANCHTILPQSPGKIRKNIRFGSTITNRLDNEGIGHNGGRILMLVLDTDTVILIQTLLPLLEISPHCATHCTLHNTIALNLF